MAIGVFDSGVGGLTVFKELKLKFPNTDLIYLGDTARVPYGNKSPDTITKYALECANILVKKYNVTALVVACNTMSSYALEPLEKAFGLPVLGVIKAGAEQALNMTKTMRIGVIGTWATIKSNQYAKMLQKISNNAIGAFQATCPLFAPLMFKKSNNSEIEVFQTACPLFVPIVEEGLLSGELVNLTVRHYLDPLMHNNIDTLILGCTHYPLLAPVIQELYPKIKITDSSTMLVKQIEEMGIAKNEKGVREILITDLSPSFEMLKERVVGNIPMNIIDLQNL